MHKEVLSLVEMQQDYISSEEEMGYDVPFATLTWERWLEMQARMLQCFMRFQRAIDQRQSRLALLIAMEMQEISTEMQKEACTWIGVSTR